MGRTPSSAPDPLVRLSCQAKKADEGVGRGPGGPPHSSCLDVPLGSRHGFQFAFKRGFLHGFVAMRRRDQNWQDHRKGDDARDQVQRLIIAAGDLPQVGEKERAKAAGKAHGSNINPKIGPTCRGPK